MNYNIWYVVKFDVVLESDRGNFNQKEEQDKLSRHQLIFIRGLPGSGKSYLSTRLATRLAAAIGEGRAEVVDPDLIDYESEEYLNFIRNLKSRETNLDIKFFPYRYLLHRTQQAISQNKCVIWNQPFSRVDDLDFTISVLKRDMEARSVNLMVTIVDIEIDPKVAFSRVEERVRLGGHGPDLEKFNDFVSSFQMASGLGYNYLVVVGENPLERNIRLILEKLGL